MTEKRPVAAALLEGSQGKASRRCEATPSRVSRRVRIEHCSNSLIWFSGNVLARHDEPLHIHVTVDVFRTIQDELFDVRLPEVITKRLDVSPHFVNHKEIAIVSITVNMELKCSRL